MLCVIQFSYLASKRFSVVNLMTVSLLLPIDCSVLNAVHKGTLMIDHDNLEEFRDAQMYDLQDEGYEDDYALTAQWARSLGGPLLDLACGTGRMALRMAAQGYQVTGVDITPEMIARARQKAAQQAATIDWVLADALLYYNGLQIRACYGNWQQDPLTATSPAMIYVCQRRV